MSAIYQSILNHQWLCCKVNYFHYKWCFFVFLCDIFIINICSVMTTITNGENLRQYKSRFFLL